MPNQPPDYISLVRFLLEPFLEESESLSLDCETLNQGRRVWLRVAIDSSHKGHVYGRGGRNLKAISTVLETTAIMAGQSIHLDIYGKEGKEADKGSNSADATKRRQPFSKPKPSPS